MRHCQREKHKKRRLLFTHFYEKEFRREFKSKAKSETYDFLEIRQDSVRFIYNLRKNSFHWQTKKNIGKHSLAIPIVETCYHSLESPMYSSVFDMPEKVNYGFFFLNNPTLKKTLFENKGVVAYQRFSDREQKWYLECENVFEKNLYFNLAAKLNATREMSYYSMPPVMPIGWKDVSVKDIRYVAAKWDGEKRMMSFRSSNPELNLALAGNQYCVETFGQRGGIIVDLCNLKVSALDRVTHLIFLRDNFETILKPFFVQYFSSMELKVTPEFLKRKTTPSFNFPCDGFIYVTSESILKFKPDLLKTVDLLSVDYMYLRDREGFSYKFIKFLYNNKKRLKANRIYEAIVYNNYSAIIIKKRKDKIYPNGRKIILSQ